ncbi:MAG TPA: ABC transporter ATP-binding protein [Selenomonadales bacterium]|nr:ABC transporter ATP-binding protein [Selenomonadales bacterium]
MIKIALDRISKQYDRKTVLSRISLTVEAGELLSLLGPSGTGKTTLLKILAGLEDADAGDILFDGQSVRRLPPEKRKAVLVFQDYLLFPHLTVGENVGFGLKMAKQSASAVRTRVSEMLQLVQLSGSENKYPRELSGGQKQRVALARALAIEPRVLLLDEPFSNLDVLLRHSMQELVFAIQRKLKITTILVTHDWAEALMFSDRMAVLDNGVVQQVDIPERVYRNPASLKVAQLFGTSVNYIDGAVRNQTFLSWMGEYRAGDRADGPYQAVVRPEQVELRADAAGEWRVQKKIFAGQTTYYHIGKEERQLWAASPPNTRHELADQVSITVNLRPELLFPKATAGEDQ